MLSTVFRKPSGVCTCIREHSIGLVFTTHASVGAVFFVSSELELHPSRHVFYSL